MKILIEVRNSAITLTAGAIKIGIDPSRINETLVFLTNLIPTMLQLDSEETEKAQSKLKEIISLIGEIQSYYTKVNTGFNVVINITPNGEYHLCIYISDDDDESGPMIAEIKNSNLFATIKLYFKLLEKLDL